MGAVDQILILGNSDPSGVPDFVANRYEDQSAGASCFLAYLDNSRGACEGLAHAQRTMEFEAPAGPHAPRQGNGRQKTASFSMPVGTQFGLPVSLQKIE